MLRSCNNFKGILKVIIVNIWKPSWFATDCKILTLSIRQIPPPLRGKEERTMIQMFMFTVYIFHEPRGIPVIFI